MLLIDYDETATCSGGACGPVWCPGSGGWSSCGVDYGAAGMVMLNPSTFSSHYADPYEIAGAPSIGVIAHELAHVFGFRHLDDRDDPALKKLHAWTIHRDGSTSPHHASDAREVYASAFALHQLRYLYPGGADTSDLDTPEWYMHEMLVSDPPYGELHEQSFANANPWALYLHGPSATYRNCETGAAPVFMAQYSEISRAPASESSVTVELQVETRFGVMGTVESRSHGPKQDEANFVQFEWHASLELTAAMLGVVTDANGEPRAMKAIVDPDGVVTERLESNNEVETTLMLYPNKASCPL